MVRPPVCAGVWTADTSFSHNSASTAHLEVRPRDASEGPERAPRLRNTTAAAFCLLKREAVRHVVPWILEDALTSAGEDTTDPTEVNLRFGEHDVELTVSTAGVASLSWPTPAMRERVALCEGEIEVDITPSAGERLVVRLPRAFAGALA